MRQFTKIAMTWKNDRTESVPPLCLVPLGIIGPGLRSPFKQLEILLFILEILFIIIGNIIIYY